MNVLISFFLSIIIDDEVVNMLYRKKYIERILGFKDKDVIKVITGLRRSGKSVIMRQIQEHFVSTGISQDHILYYNFESFECSKLRNSEDLYLDVKAKINDQQRYYLFFDEIQNVEDWQRCINSMRVDICCDIYITGSNANLLSGELATYIAGRYIEFKIYPFSFQEYMEAMTEQNLLQDKRTMFMEYLKYGGMPFVCYLEDKTKFKEYMSGVFSTIVLNDIITRNNIRNPQIMERILYYAIDNIGHIFSATSISKYLKNEKINVSVDTVIHYLRIACNALILIKSMRSDLLGKEVLKTQEKYYLTDHSFKQYLFGTNIRDIELILENIIFIEMQRRGYDVYTGDINKKEVDFICTKMDERIYIQVSYLMYDEATRNREFSSLLMIQDNYPKYVLSMDDFDFSQQGIIHKNIIDFLLEN